MKRFLLVFAMILACAATMMAQRTISGTVTDDTGSPLPFANVFVEGTTIGTTTDIDGNYTLKVPEGSSTLKVSYTGFADQSLDLGDSNSLSFTMSEGVVLDNVVVTALGIKREKKSLGYATQEVGGDEVTRIKDANFMNSLSGKVSGVQIKSSGTMGGSSDVIIRGRTSLTRNNQALFVIDGTPISNAITNSSSQQQGRGGYDFGNAASDINPEDIESINVLKGAAATALYGARAANGVVLITTKKGTKNKGIGVSVSSGFTAGMVDQTTMPKYQKEYGAGYSDIQGWYSGAGEGRDGLDLDDLDGDGNADFAAAVYEDASYGAAFDPSLSVYDWRSYYDEIGTFGQLFPWVAAENDASNSFYETMRTFNNNVTLDGGTDKSTYRLGFTRFDQQGIVPNSKIDRNTVAFSAGYDLTEKLRVGSTINYVLTNGRGRYGTGYSNNNPNQSFRQWYQTNVDMNDQREAYEQTGLNISWNPYGLLDPSQSKRPHYFDNYYFNAYENVPTDTRNRIFGNMEMEYKIIDGLSLLGRVSTDRYNEIQEQRIAVGSVDVSSYSRYNRSFYENNTDLFLNYSTYLGGETLSVDAMLGTNIRRSGVDDISAQTNGGLVVPNVYSLANTLSGIEAPVENPYRLGTNGYFGRLNFGYNQFLYLDVTGRYDVSSTLPEGNNAYFYPSASLSFVFSELMDANWFDLGKFRLNYAEVGNDAPVQSIADTYVLGTPFGGQALASANSTKNNPDLRPENTRSIEAGLEMRFLRDRVGFDVSLYRSNTYDQIIPVTVTAASGNLRTFKNAGEMQNQGVELSLNVRPIQKDNFSWDIGFNWSKNQNEVISLFDDQTNLQLASVQGGITLNATIGQPYGAIWGTDYVYDDSGNPIVYPHWNGGVRYRKTGTPEVIGDINPDFIGGLRNNFTVGPVSLGFLIDFQKGGDFFSLDMWYGTATGIYDFTAGTNRDGNPIRALPGDGGGIFLDDNATTHATDDEGNYMYDADGNPISSGVANDEAFYASDVYNSLGYVYAPNAYHVYDASFVKLREANISFGLPSNIVKKTPFQALNVSIVGRNLWIIHKNSPYTDPQAGLSAGNIGQGNQSGAYPSLREVGVNLTARF